TRDASLTRAYDSSRRRLRRQACRPRAIAVRRTSFYFQSPPPTALYPLSLHDALPIFAGVYGPSRIQGVSFSDVIRLGLAPNLGEDRKSTRLNSSHVAISYAVLCLDKKPDDRHAVVHPQLRPPISGTHADTSLARLTLQ